MDGETCAHTTQDKPTSLGLSKIRVKIACESKDQTDTPERLLLKSSTFAASLVLKSSTMDFSIVAFAVVPQTA